MLRWMCGQLRDAALLYMQHNTNSSANRPPCDRPGGSRDQRVRILASAGVDHSTQAANKEGSLADHRFTRAGKVDTLFPMTWMGRLNPNLIIFEALALQQQNVIYPQSLDRYKKAAKLLENQRKKVPYELLTNIGVLGHGFAGYDEALTMYHWALEVMDGDSQARKGHVGHCRSQGWTNP